MAKEGLEPTHLAVLDFESSASAIPPLGQALHRINGFASGDKRSGGFGCANHSWSFRRGSIPNPERIPAVAVEGRAHVGLGPLEALEFGLGSRWFGDASVPSEDGGRGADGGRAFGCCGGGRRFARSPAELVADGEDGLADLTDSALQIAKAHHDSPAAIISHPRASPLPGRPRWRGRVARRCGPPRPGCECGPDPPARPES